MSTRIKNQRATFNLVAEPLFRITVGGTSSWTRSVNLDINIFVISEPKWLKFGLQAHFFKMFGHTKFQLSIYCTFKVMKLLVKVTKY